MGGSVLLYNTYVACKYTVKKKVGEFPVPSRDVTSKLSLGGNNEVITELLLPRGSLVSDILAGDGKTHEPFFMMYTSSVLGLCRNAKGFYTRNIIFLIKLIQNPPPFSVHGLVLLYCPMYCSIYRHTVKKRFASFPSPAGMSLPNSPWAGIMKS